MCGGCGLFVACRGPRGEPHIDTAPRPLRGAAAPAVHMPPTCINAGGVRVLTHLGDKPG